MSTHVYIATECLHTKKYRPFGPCHINGTKIGSPAYQKGTYNQGASKAPPATPPSGGGGGPPPPAPGSGGGTSAGPPCPGDRRPLVIAASTAARRMIDRHGGGNPMHCSRNSSSWIRVHMPSGTSRKTVSNRRTRSSSSALAAVGGACDGPAPGSSSDASAPVSRALLILQQPHPSDAALHAMVSPALAVLALGTPPPPAHEVPHLHMHQTSKQKMVSVSIHQTYTLVYQKNTK
jgi:hypothetical protein